MNAKQVNPYIGPRTFLKKERNLFFGREREASDLTALVASERLVLFYAQSGAGKSSVINTRLIPNLEDKGYEVLPVGRVSGDVLAASSVGNIFVYNLIRGVIQRTMNAPGLARLTGLSLADFLKGLNVEEEKYFFDPGLLDALGSPVAGGMEVVRRALIIDQFEELFSTHPEVWEKREDFFIQLKLAMEADPHLWVVLVMREDYVASLDPYAHILPGGLRLRYYMQRLEREAALKAVTQPALNAGRPFAPGVAEKLVNDLCSIKVQRPNGELDVQPGQYVEPVQLQVVCYGLWEQLPEGDQITEKDLQEVGDVNQSLGKHFDRRVGEVARAKNVKERLIREWFRTKLITPGGIRSMVLQEKGKSGGLDKSVIEALQPDLVRAEQRGGGTWYELTHDRLVEPILESNKDWEDKNSSLIQKQAKLWVQNGYKDAWLLSADALLEADALVNENIGDLNEEEIEFLESSHNFQKQVNDKKAAERRDLENAQKLAKEQSRSARVARRGTVIAGLLAIAAVIALFWALYEQDISKDRQNQAQASELSVIASERADSQLDLAMKLGLQADTFGLLADPKAGNDQARKAMLALLLKSNRYLKTVPSEEEITQIQFSPDGGKFASLDKSGVTLWDIDQTEPLNSIPINGHYSGVTAIALSKDAPIFASGSTNGTLALWDADAHIPLSEPFQSGEQRIYGLAISPDGKLLASSSYDDSGEVILWDISNPKAPVQFKERLAVKRIGSVITIAFSPDGKTLASGNTDGSIMLWDVTTRQRILETPLKEHSGGVWSLIFSPDGNTLASGSYDDSVILWDVSDPQGTHKISDQLYARNPVDIEVIAISPDGSTLAAGDDNGNITLWDISEPATPSPLNNNEPLNGNTSWIISLAFSPDSNILAAGSYSTAPKLILWDVKRGSQLGEAILDHKSSIWGLAFANEGRELISGSEDSTIRFWNVSDISKGGSVRADGKIEREDQHPGSPTSIAFSPDGRLLVSTGNDGTILLDAETQKKIGEGAILENPDKSIWVYQTLDEEKNEYAIHLMKSATDEAFTPPIFGQDPFFSPDGRWLVYQTLGKDTRHQLNIWDVEKKRDLGVKINGSFLTFSPDGNSMLYQTLDPAGGKTLLNLWDVINSKPVQKDIDGVYQGFSPDGRFVVYQTYDELNVAHFNLLDKDKPGKPVYSDAIGGAYLTINPDTLTLVYQSTDTQTFATLINLFDISNSVLLKSIPVYDFREASNGKSLAYITFDPESGDTLINTLDLETNDKSSTKGVVWRWSDDGNYLLYSTFDKYGQTTNVRDLLTGSLVRSDAGSSFNGSLRLGGYFIYEISYSGINNLVVIDDSGRSYGPFEGRLSGLTALGNYLLYDTENGLRIWSPDNRFSGIEGFRGRVLGIFNDDTLLIYEAEDGVHVWDLVKTESVGEPFHGTYQGISPDGKILATGNEENAIVLWDIAKTWPLGEAVAPEEGEVTSAALSPDGETLAYANPMGINLTKPEAESKPSITPNEHSGAVTGVYFSTDKNVMLTLGEDGNTIAWDMNTLAAISDPIPGTNTFFSKQNKYVVVFDGIDTTRVWNLETHALEGQPFVGKDLRLDFSSTDRYIWIYDGERDQTTISDMETHTPIGGPFEGQPNINFSKDDKFMTVFDYDSTSIKLWDLTAGKEVSTSFAGSGASFSPNGKYLAVNGEGSKNVEVFELETMQQILSTQGQYITFSPDGSFLEVDDWENNTVALSDLTTGSYFGEVLNGSGSGMWVDGNTLIWSVGVVDSESKIVKNMVMLINLVTRQMVGEPFEGNLVFAPDTNKLLALVDYGRKTTTFWDVNRHQPSEAFINGTDYGYTYTSNNIFIVYDGRSDQTTFWEINTQKQIGDAIQGYYYSSNISSSDGRVIALQDSANNKMIFIDIKTGKQIGKSVDTYHDYLSLCSSTDSIVSAWYNAAESAVVFWDMERDISIGDLEIPENIYLSGVFIDPECKVAAVSDGTNGRTYLYGISTKKKITSEPIEGMFSVFNSDGTILGITKDSETRFFNTSNGTKVDKTIPGNYYTNLVNGIVWFQQYTPGSNTYVNSIWDLDTFTQLGNGMINLYYDYSLNKELVIYGSAGASVWNIKEDEPVLLKDLTGHASPITAMVFGHSGKKLASLASDGIILTDIFDGSSVHLDTDGYYGQLSSIMVFGEDEKEQDTFFTALGMDGSILTWDIVATPPELVKIIDPLYSNAYQKTISPDGRYLVYVNNQSRLNIYDILAQEQLLNSPIKLSTCCIFSITFSPDGDVLFFNDGGKVYQWRRAEWGEPASSPHEEATFGKNISEMTIVMDPALPTNPKYLVATSDADGFTQIWEWSKASRVGEPISGNIQIYGYNGETRVLYYGDGDGGLFRFSLDPADWHEALCEKAKQNLTQKEWSLFLPRLPYPTDPGEAACPSFPLDTIVTETALP